MSSDYKKVSWYEAESRAATYLEEKGYTILERNYTIRGGELDIIAMKGQILTFIEVKLVNHVFDLHDYVTPDKLRHLHKTIECYLREHRHDGDIQLDVIFVRGQLVIDHLTNVSGWW